MTSLDPERTTHEERGHNSKVNLGHHPEPQIKQRIGLADVTTTARSFTDNAIDMVDGSVIGVKAPAAKSSVPAPGV